MRSTPSEEHPPADAQAKLSDRAVACAIETLERLDISVDPERHHGVHQHILGTAVTVGTTRWTGNGRD